MNAERKQRLQSDLELIRQLDQESSIFSFESVGDPPDRYTLNFRGRGVQRSSASTTELSILDVHRCDLRLPYSYPQRPPDIRWLTSIFHPNVSFSGFIHLRDLGLPWTPDLTLDIVCERLWDVARLAYVNLEKATNYSAKNHFDGQTQLTLPVDSRSLRDQLATRATNRNVVKYARRGAAQPRKEEVFYIGEETPIPDLPRRVVRTPRPFNDDDDILYIGD